MFSLCNLVQACGKRCHTAPKNCWRCGRDGGGNHLSHRCPDLNSLTIKVHLFYPETNRHSLRTSPLNPPAFLWMCYCITSVKADHYQNSYSGSQTRSDSLVLMFWITSYCHVAKEFRFLCNSSHFFSIQVIYLQYFASVVSEIGIVIKLQLSDWWLTWLVLDVIHEKQDH